MFTNEHCISSQSDVDNTEVQFDYQRSVCESGLPNTPDSVAGSSFIIDNGTLDFALFTVEDFASIISYGYLDLDPRTPVLGEEIYIPQHGNANPKEFGIESDYNSGNVCRIDDAIIDGLGSNTDTGYFCDTFGGSSGSPVLARSNHQVIGLHHLGAGTTCDSTHMNTAVRIDLIYPLVEPYIYGGCSADSYEPDDSSGQASLIFDGNPQDHSICPVGDEDWVRFTLSEESGIALETSGSIGDTEMWLYNSSLTQLDYDDDDGDGYFSYIERACGVNALPVGTYYVKVGEYAEDEEIESYQIAFDVLEACGSSDPDIAITPTSLTSLLQPDRTMLRTFNVLNQGGADLDWTIYDNPEAAIVDQADYYPEAILWDNGPLVNSPGTGSGGADESVLQIFSLNMNILGFGHSVLAGLRVADDFTVDPGGWYISDIHFYAYMTGSSTTSPILAVNYRIWDGPPDDPGSSVIFGDTSTDRLVNTAWAGVYRVDEGTSGNTLRPVMDNTVSAGVNLSPGTYWLDWQTDGNPAYSGPWAPPITIDGQATTGNALQYNEATGVWTPVEDTGSLTPQGFPFLINGAAGGCTAGLDIPWVEVVPTSGTTGSGGQTTVEVTFDSSGLSPGSYSGDLCIDNNDPDEDPKWLPVNLEVISDLIYMPLVTKN
jgi:hypothetical protein